MSWATGWNIASGVLLVVLMCAFIGVVIWAWSGRQKRRFDEAAQLALDEEDRAIDVEDMEQRQ